MIYSAEYADAGTLTVTTGGTSQEVFDRNVRRKTLLIQNPEEATETLFVNIGASAGTTNGSIELAPGGSLNMPQGMMMTTQAINVTAATTSHRFIAKEGV